MGLWDFLFGQSKKAERTELRRYIVDDVVIEDALAQGSVMRMIDPQFLSIDIYGSHKVYRASQEQFSRVAQYAVAIEWYRAEVYNGGHGQFYSNSTGIVWEDARDGLAFFGLDQSGAVLEDSIRQMGGSPSFERDERVDQMEVLNLDFEDLDTRFYQLTEDVDAAILGYAKMHRGAFYFDGKVLVHV